MYIHELNPIAFSLFNFKIYWYSLSYLFGFIFSYYYVKFILNKDFVKINFKIFEDFLGWAVLGVIFGGRIGYVILYNLDFYVENPIEILKIWQGGMSFHGGLIGVILSIFLFSKSKKINFFDLLNLVSSCAPIGLFLGRLANFVNRELIGRPTNSDWGVLFFEDDVLRHPSQIYEAIFEGLIIFIVIFYIIKRKYYTYINIYSLFLIMYGIFRFTIEFYREPDSHLGFIFPNISMGQLLCLPMIIIGLIFLRKKNVRD